MKSHHLLVLLFAFICACCNDEMPDDENPTGGGNSIELGRRLFYDPILSRDSTMSCASCHNPAASFADNLVTPFGVTNETGPRNTMALINFAFVPNLTLNWDGKFHSLASQAIEPVENEIELAENWDNVEDKLRCHPTYPEYFRTAFGIENSSQITRDLATKAIEQFELTLISSDSYYDRACFFGRRCSAWYGTFSRRRRNGFEDGGVTGDLGDNGRFKAPTLRNIALTAPYMHDGRFATLEEVMDHYADGGHFAPNVDAFVPLIDLDEQEKADIIAFLHALTDTTFTTNPAYQNPF